MSKLAVKESDEKESSEPKGSPLGFIRGYLKSFKFRVAVVGIIILVLIVGDRAFDGEEHEAEMNEEEHGKIVTMCSMIAENNTFLTVTLGDEMRKSLANLEATEPHESWLTYGFMFFVSVVVLIFVQFLEGEYDIATRSLTGTKFFTWNRFILYRVDYWVSQSGMSKPIALSAVTLGVVVFGGAGLYSIKEENTLGESLWEAWTFVIDSGAHADEEAPDSACLALLLTVCGMLVFALVVSIISDAISEKFDSLKQGKAAVIESGHTLVLGWSDKTLSFIEEIAIANASNAGGVIVVLADRDKEEMEKEIHDSGIKVAGTMVVVRKGAPTNPIDLSHVSASTARSITVMSPSNLSSDEADAWVLRVTLCLKGLGTLGGHIVVEVADVDNVELVNIVGGMEVEIVVAHNFIGRLIVQSSRQQGLSQILEHILGFEGDEFYIKEWPETVGKKFGEMCFKVKDAILFGVRSSAGETHLNPPNEYIIQNGDSLIVLAEDDDSYEPVDEFLYKWNPDSARRHIRMGEKNSCAERILLIGWRRDLADLMVEIDGAADPGSELTLFSNVLTKDREAKLASNGREKHKHLRNVSLKHCEGNPISRRDLERLPLEEYNSIYILAREEFGEDMETCDGHSLASLLLVRDIRKQRIDKLKQFDKHRDASLSYARCVSQEKCTITSEILDEKTRNLICVAGVSDYVMSNRMVSAALAMVAECRHMNGILQELLTSDGNEIYLREVENYVQPGEEACFWDIFARCRARGEICFGYKGKDDPIPTLNPKEKDARRVWSSGDKVVVIAEE